MHGLTTEPVAALDLAFVHDWCALVIVARQAGPDGIERIVVPHYDLRKPTPSIRLDPIEVADDYTAIVARHRCIAAVADPHYLEVLRRPMLRRGVPLLGAPAGDGRIRAFVLVRDLLRRHLLVLPREIADHMRAVRMQVRAGGAMSVFADRTNETGHADLAFALVAAIAHDERLNGPLGMPTFRGQTFAGGWET